MERICQTGLVLIATIQIAVNGCGVKIVQDAVAVLPMYHWSSGYCLNIVPHQTDWYGALGTCKEKKGELMVIKNEEEQTELVNGLQASADMRGWSFWIGLFQVDATVHTSYQWADTDHSCSHNQASDRRNCVKGTYKVNGLLCGFQKCCYDDTKTPQCVFPVVPDTFIGYNAWGRGSPTVTNDRMCVMMKDSISYRWVDLPCLDSKTAQVGFVCRFKENPAPDEKRPTYPPPEPSTAEPKNADDSGTTNLTWIAIGIVGLLLLIILASTIIVCCIRKSEILKPPAMIEAFY